MPDWQLMGERMAVRALRWSPKGAFSHAVGWLSRRRVPRPLRQPLYKGFARVAGADLSAVDRPLESFERFDDFFTRPLPPGARPLAEGEGVIVSPVDAVVSETGVATGGRLIQAKGLDYTVRGLLADAAEAAHFEGGAYATLYLAPRDYHRIHSPATGRILGYRHIPGAFFLVNALSVRHVPGLFSVNERLVTFIETTALGRVAVVKVAATGVGHITLAYDREVGTHRRGPTGRNGWAQRYGSPRPIAAGAELGMFHLGSTVILLFEPGRVRLDLATGDRVRVGERIGEASELAARRAPPRRGSA